MSETDDQTTSTRTPAVRTVYRAVLGLYLLLGVAQIFLAGLGVFSLLGSGPGFEPHRTLGFVLSGVALLIVVMALVARAGGRAIGLAVLLFVLAAFGQSLFAALGEETAFWGGVHALSGLSTLGIAGYLQAQVKAGTPISRR